jgi:hypothetical protein
MAVLENQKAQTRAKIDFDSMMESPFHLIVFAFNICFCVLYYTNTEIIYQTSGITLAASSSFRMPLAWLRQRNRRCQIDRDIVHSGV